MTTVITPLLRQKLKQFGPALAFTVCAAAACSGSSSLTLHGMGAAGATQQSDDHGAGSNEGGARDRSDGATDAGADVGGEAATIATPTPGDVGALDTEFFSAGNEAGAGGTSETQAAGGTTARIRLAPPESDHAALYVSLDRLPPTAADGTALTIDKTTVGDPSPLLGVSGDAVHLTLSSFSLASDPNTDIAEEPFTILVWLRPGAATSQVVLDKREKVGTTYLGYYLGVHDSKLSFTMSGADYNIGVASPILIPHDCNWHLATITSDRHSIFGGRIYLDGQVVRTFVDLEDSMKNQASLFIGAAHYSSDGLTSDSFLGGIDELMILKSVLSAEQISAYYRALRAQAQDAGPC